MNHAQIKKGIETVKVLSIDFDAVLYDVYAVRAFPQHSNLKTYAIRMRIGTAVSGNSFLQLFGSPHNPPVEVWKHIQCSLKPLLSEQFRPLYNQRANVFI